jgi:hypothetical protein
MPLRRSAATSALFLITIAVTVFTVSCRSKLNEGAIHKDDYQKAYIYAYPMIANYKAMYEFNIDKSSSQYKGPFNTVVSDPHVFTPKDTAVVTPNADTPYSMLQADLRAEPVIFCVPDVEKGRYYSVQLIDMYTFNYGYVGSRSTGNGGGCYMISGPAWRGATPPGILKAFQSETQFSLLIYRTELFGPKDIENVKKIQAGYTVQTLSSYTHQPAPPPAPPINFPKFTDEAFKGDFPKFLNFLLQFCPGVAEEAATRLQFATIGIEPGKPFDIAQLSDSEKADLSSAVADGYKAIQDRTDQVGKNVNNWKVASPFGNRDSFHGDWLRRAAAAMLGIYGNDSDEAVYPWTKVDGIGTPLDGSKYNYTLTFKANSYPPVNAFWSVTMYDAKNQLLVENPIDRYLISSAMLSTLKKNADGSLTIYIQKDEPSADKKANWLPAPNGPIYLVMRLYWPRKNPPPSILPIMPPGQATWDPPGILIAR